MSQKSEPVFIIQRRSSRVVDGKWSNVRVADDRSDARDYVNRMNKTARLYAYRVDPNRVTKL